ncbi:hypothetical protein M011DRAFT_9696 [Sporormia fimetaria CBS 119925]|uniref:Uncharacterized protein n=1 Tax=Sporormia fimetaria CBS 119925 TaxID=1340428 RepID=A0A6A6VRN3_9PLEO|nr:hypothetical protein M011DRAFT_9696 [Sporormia fimetaria CBS 119925]
MDEARAADGSLTTVQLVLHPACPARAACPGLREGRMHVGRGASQQPAAAILPIPTRASNKDSIAHSHAAAPHSNHLLGFLSLPQAAA